MVIKKLLNKTAESIDEAKFKVDSIYNSVSDSVDEAIDFTSATFTKAYAGIIGTYHAIKFAGISIALITAPVPTLVAISILWLMELSIDSMKSDIDKELTNKNKKRQFDTAVKMLKKYGKIPKTAIVETEHVKMEIDSVTGSVNGVILTGKFEDVELCNIETDDLLDLASSSPDSDTKSLIEAYLSYRDKSKSIDA